MREDLLGYLLGALEPEESRRVEDLLAEDPDLRSELEQLEQMLRPLEADAETFEPPANLISRTLDHIEQHRPRSAGLPPAVGSTMLSEPGFRWQSARRFRAADAFVATISMIAFVGLLFPAILESRFEARQAQCQDHLRQLGTSLTHFAMRNPGQRLPAISLDGPLAFAGNFSVQLKEAGLIDRDDIVWCASRNRPDQDVTIPSQREIQAATGRDLAVLQQVAGGHLAYTMGVMEDEVYGAPRMQSRATFAILGDAPIPGALDHWEYAHDGRGFNLLFEDGAVRFISRLSQDHWFDHPFLNKDNRKEAGLNVNDAALGESSRAPFVWVKQTD